MNKEEIYRVIDGISEDMIGQLAELRRMVAMLPDSPTPQPEPEIVRDIDAYDEVHQPAKAYRHPDNQFIITRMHKRTGPENSGGMHIAFLSCKDKDGNPLDGVKIHWRVTGSELNGIVTTGEKGPGAVEIPIDRNVWEFEIDEFTSDGAEGITTNINEEVDAELGNYNGHYSYDIEWTKVR